MNIGRNDIHLWFAHDREISDRDLLAQYLAILTDAERQQQKRFYFQKHQHQYLVTRALVRSTLSLYLEGIAPHQWEFDKNPYGKPSIKNHTTLPLQFNLSHTDGMIVMAVTLERDIGVDVEWLLRKGQTIELAEHFFSSHEVAQLHALPADQQHDRFFDLWTLKEAYIKAYGMGLSIPLDQFSFSFSQHRKITISFDPRWKDSPGNWHFWQVQPDNNYKIALALQTGEAGPYSLTFRKTVPMRESREISICSSRS